MELIVCIANSANISIIAGIKLGVPGRENIMGRQKIRGAIGPAIIGMAVDIYVGAAIGVGGLWNVEGHVNHDIVEDFIGANDIEIKGIGICDPCLGRVIIGSTSHEKLKCGDSIDRGPHNKSQGKSEERRFSHITSQNKYISTSLL